MASHNIIPFGRQLSASGFRSMPALFLDGGEKSWRRFVEFFTARIRNRNTREAYARAVIRFSAWAETHKLSLDRLSPPLIAAYIEELSGTMSAPSVKQHLAAIRMLLDYLVTGGALPMNPAAAVRGPKHSVKRGKTPVLDAEQARQLLDSIDTSTLVGLRDRAFIAVMVFSFARVSAVLGMNVNDYYPDGKRYWFRLHEKGGKFHEVPAHHKADEYVDEFIAAAGIGAERGTPLFRSFNSRREMTPRRLSRREALAMIKRRARDCLLPPGICCHTFRATGITAYLLAGGTLENDQPYCILCCKYSGLKKRRFVNRERIRLVSSHEQGLPVP